MVLNLLSIKTSNCYLWSIDGIDGKQARRTQTSGPLGELFDHGLDSWTAVLIPTCMYSAFGRTMQGISPLRMYFCLWNVFVNFHLSHWEKYNTGTLFLPWGYDASMIVSLFLSFWCCSSPETSTLPLTCHHLFISTSVFIGSSFGVCHNIHVWPWSLDISLSWRHISWSYVWTDILHLRTALKFPSVSLEHLQVSSV